MRTGKLWAYGSRQMGNLEHIIYIIVKDIEMGKKLIRVIPW